MRKVSFDELRVVEAGGEPLFGIDLENFELGFKRGSFVFMIGEPSRRFAYNFNFIQSTIKIYINDSDEPYVLNTPLHYIKSVLGLLK